jgi:hypothetical protein
MSLYNLTQYNLDTNGVAKQEVLRETYRLLSLIKHGSRKKDAFNNSSIVASVFVTAVTFSPSRCPAMIGVIHLETQTDEKDL